MGQSAKSRTKSQTREIPRLSAGAAIELSVFASELGWFGLLGNEGKTVSLWFGHATADEVRQAADRFIAQGAQEGLNRECVESDWNSQLRRQLQQFAEGTPVDFTNVELALPAQTDFQKRVVATVRRIKYGQTIAYGELAKRAGFPGAARAVGSVMATNRIPIIIPCHRVIAAGNRLGGFSAPRGVNMKQHLLDMEAKGLVVK